MNTETGLALLSRLRSLPARFALARAAAFLLLCGWFLLSRGVIVLGVVVVIARLAFPQIHRYHSEIEYWLSTQTDHVVQFDGLEGYWRDWYPELSLEGLRFFASDIGTEPVGEIDSVHLSLDPVLSILRWQPAAHTFSIRGLGLHIRRDRFGNWSLQSGNGRTRHNPAFQQDMVDWLSQQQGVYLQDMQLLVSDAEYGIDALPLNGVNISHEYLQGDADVAIRIPLPADYGDSLSLSLHGQGSVLSRDWWGEMLLLWQQPGWPGWAGSLTWQQEAGALRLWVQWQAGRVRRGRAGLVAEQLRISREDQALDIPEVALRAEAERLTGGDWQLDTQLDTLRLADHQWPVAAYRLVWSRAGKPWRWRGEFDYLDMGDSLLALEFAPFAAIDVTPLAEYQPRGALEDVQLEWGGLKPANVQARFSSLQLQHQPSGAWVQEGSGWFYYQDGALSLHCSGPARFALPRHLDGERTVDCLRGELHGTRRGAAWHWQLDTMQARIDDAHTVFLSGSLLAPERLQDAELRLRLQQLPLASVQDWLPLSLVDEDFWEWSGEALLGGEIAEAELVFAESQFQARLTTRDATVRYDSRWPALEQLDASVRIAGDTVTVEAQGGILEGAVIQSGSQLRLLDMASDQQAAHITATIRGVASEAQRFILDSPLLERLPGLARLDATGDVRVDMELLLPFSAEPEPEVRGAVHLDDVQLAPDFGPGLEQLQGAVRFANGVVRGDTLRARYQGYPVFVTMSDTPGEARRFAIEGRLPGRLVNEQLLEAWGSGPWEGLLQGEGEWRLEALADAAGEGPWRVNLSSDLQGLALALPAPFGKDAPSRRPLSLGATVDTDAGELRLRVNYDDRLLAEVAVAEASGKRRIAAASLGLGEAMPPLQPGGLRVRGGLSELNVGDWLALASGNASLDDELALDLALSVEHLRFLNSDFADVGLYLANQGQALAEAPCHQDVRGAIAGAAILHEAAPATPSQGIQWPNANAPPVHDAAPAAAPQASEGPSADAPAMVLCGEGLQGLAWLDTEVVNEPALHVRLQRLHIAEAEDWQAGRVTNPADFPATRVAVDELRRNGLPLGRLQFATQPVVNGLDIVDLTLDGPHAFAFGSGQWTGQGEQQQSQTSLVVKSGSFNDLLQVLGYDNPGVSRGKTRVAMAVEWSGGPGDFALENLFGSLDIDIGKGNMQEVEPGAGRIFGLFTLGTLWRRLSLDFSDLFGRGLAFDSIEGDFALVGGLAQIRQLQLLGPAADINITGNIDLEYASYDQRATVTPRITESLPLASALLGPVGIGVGAVYYLDRRYTRLLPDPLSGTLQAQYRITGPWDDPEVESLAPAPADDGASGGENGAQDNGLEGRLP